MRDRFRRLDPFRNNGERSGIESFDGQRLRIVTPEFTLFAQVYDRALADGFADSRK